MACFPCLKKKKKDDRGIYIEEESYIGPTTIVVTTGCFFIIGPFSLLFLLAPCDRRPKEVVIFDENTFNDR